MEQCPHFPQSPVLHDQVQAANCPPPAFEYSSPAHLQALRWFVLPREALDLFSSQSHALAVRTYAVLPFHSLCVHVPPQIPFQPKQNWSPGLCGMSVWVGWFSLFSFRFALNLSPLCFFPFSLDDPFTVFCCVDSAFGCSYPTHLFARLPASFTSASPSFLPAPLVTSPAASYSAPCFTFASAPALYSSSSSPPTAPSPPFSSSAAVGGDNRDELVPVCKDPSLLCANCHHRHLSISPLASIFSGSNTPSSPSSSLATCNWPCLFCRCALFAPSGPTCQPALTNRKAVISFASSPSWSSSPFSGITPAPVSVIEAPSYPVPARPSLFCSCW